MSGIAQEFIDRMSENGGAVKWDYAERLKNAKGHLNESTNFDVECFKETALEMCLEAGVEILLYTMVVEPIVIDGAILGVITESKSGRTAILGKTVVDCTGDGDLVSKTGAPMTMGRENDNLMRPFVLMFRVGGLDVQKILGYVRDNPDEWQPQYKTDPFKEIGSEPIISRISGFYKLIDKAKEAGELPEFIHYLRFENMYVNRGMALCNSTRIYRMDGTNVFHLTQGEIEGHKQMKQLIQFMHTYLPGGENAFVVDVAPTIGVRETRRIVGEFHMKDEDVYENRTFEDTILTVHRKLPLSEKKILVDVHSPDPIEGSADDILERDPDRAPMKAFTYHLPYRILIPQKVDFMLISGRLMSTSHMIEAFTRGMTFCMLLGQVAGTAAALSAKIGVTPKDVPFGQLKDSLISQGYKF
jgi:hypothetical protein